VLNIELNIFPVPLAERLPALNKFIGTGSVSEIQLKSEFNQSITLFANSTVTQVN